VSASIQAFWPVHNRRHNTQYKIGKGQGQREVKDKKAQRVVCQTIFEQLLQDVHEFVREMHAKRSGKINFDFDFASLFNCDDICFKNNL
jgi:hypothetical protein